MPLLDAIGFPLRGLPPDTVAERLAAWVRWPIERGRVAEVEHEGRRLRVHTLPVGEGAELRTVVELRRRRFLAEEEIVCFLAGLAPVSAREADVVAVETGDCPFEPFAVVLAPERLRFRIGNPFAPGALATGPRRVALGLLAGRVEPAPAGTRLAALATALVTQDPEVPGDVFTVTARVEEAPVAFANAATGVRCLRLRAATAAGGIEIVAQAADVLPGVEAGAIVVAEGELLGTMEGRG